MRRSAIRFSLLTLLVLLLSHGPGGAGCVEGGVNNGQRTPGNTDEGVEVYVGDIAIDPTGTYTLSRSRGELVYAEIETSVSYVLEGLGDADRVAFGFDGRTIYVTTASPSQLLAYDLVDRAVRWTANTRRAQIGNEIYPLVTVTPDDQFVVITERYQVAVLSTADGAVDNWVPFERGVEDVDVTQDAERLIVTLEHSWSGDTPQTEIHAIDLATNEDHVIVVPNCTSELSVLADGTRAFLAPTRCGRDPVSVIDLTDNSFVRNLPGFGPVAVARDERTLVAFVDNTAADEGLYQSNDPKPSDEVRYHLMFIDAETLAFNLLPIGDDLPRYALTPSGKIVLVDSDTYWNDGRTRIVDIPSRSIQQLSGPSVELDDFVISSDSSQLFAIDELLFEVDIPERRVIQRSMHFVPQNLNIMPDDTRLILREDEDWLWVYDTTTYEPVRAIWVGGAPITPAAFDEAGLDR